MSYEIKMDSKGRIQIPKKVRDEMNLKPGQKLKIKIEDGNLVILKPISANFSKELTIHTNLLFF